MVKRKTYLMRVTDLVKQLTFLVKRAADDNTAFTLEDYGHYKNGLSSAEVKAYLRYRSGATGQQLRKIIRDFNREMYGSTCAIGPNNKPLIYREDAKRFADKILDGKETYFD